MSKILIVEDEESIADLEKDYLELSGFEVEIENQGETGLVRAIKEDFDLLILDLMLPEVDGFEICREVREKKDIPIIMVSAKKDDIDKIRGLGLGADDYMTKPFSPSELVARVKAHLAPFVPGHSVVQIEGMLTRQGAVSAAPFGSASILPISWMYIRMMGAEGLKKASQVAILNANYIASRLQDAFPVLYTGRDGRVAHECILDIRPLKEETGISELDIAKRLIDYGFHAPTMSFPVAGTLMVEPTESESKVELDRFIDAMLAIRAEIDQVKAGVWPLEDNPLVNAPHIQSELVAEWAHPYSREVAVFPAGVADKYWPTVKRLDDVYGDRNLFCSCVPIGEYQ